MKKEQVLKANVKASECISEAPIDSEIAVELRLYRAGTAFLQNIEDIVKCEPGIRFHEIHERTDINSSPLEVILALTYLVEKVALYKGRFGYFHRDALLNN